MVVLNIWCFHPYLGKIPILTNICFKWVETTNQNCMSTISATWRNSCRVPDDHQGPVYSMKWDTTTRRKPWTRCRERRKTQQEICQVYENNWKCICFNQYSYHPCDWNMSLDLVDFYGMHGGKYTVRHMGPSWDICLYLSRCSVKNLTSGESWGGFVILGSWAQKTPVVFSFMFDFWAPKVVKTYHEIDDLQGHMVWNRSYDEVFRYTEEYSARLQRCKPWTFSKAIGCRWWSKHVQIVGIGGFACLDQVGFGYLEDHPI